jgi:hypothetical protein
MTAILMTLLGFAGVSSGYMKLALVLLRVAAVAAVVGGPYVVGRMHGGDACEAKHEAARLEAEAKRQAAEDAARKEIEREEHENAEQERNAAAAGAVAVAVPGCPDGRWLREQLSGLR